MTGLATVLLLFAALTAVSSYTTPEPTYLMEEEAEDEQKEQDETYFNSQEENLILNKEEDIQTVEDTKMEDIMQELKRTSSEWVKAAATGCSKTGTYGGNGGGAFDLGCRCEAPRKIVFWYANQFIRAISISGKTYGATPQGTTRQVMILHPREVIIAVAVSRTGGLVRQIGFLTQLDGKIKQHGPYGGASANGVFTIIRKNIVSFYGRYGAALDSIGFYYRD